MPFLGGFSYAQEGGGYQAQKWVEQGKYNLTPEELKEERKRINDEYNRSFKRAK